MILGHIAIFILSIIAVWFFGGILVDSIGRIAKSVNKSGFIVAFFVLGFLTSISEISVMVNATLRGVPQVSAGNLSGASIVIMLAIIPLLALLSSGVTFFSVLNKKQLALALVVIGTPTLFLYDGLVTANEGVFCFVIYALLMYVMQREEKKKDMVTEVMVIENAKVTFFDSIKILTAGIVIFLCGRILVSEALFFATFFNIPSSLVGLLVLSLGTNIPEIIIAIRSTGKGRSDIALGDYLGSASMNTLIFAVLAILNGTFFVEKIEFIVSGVVFIFGLVIFFIFAGSKNMLSRFEGFILMGLYLVFAAFQSILLIENAIQ